MSLLLPVEMHDIINTGVNLHIVRLNKDIKTLSHQNVLVGNFLTQNVTNHTLHCGSTVRDSLWSGVRISALIPRD